jgi:hypothetical protein
MKTFTKGADSDSAFNRISPGKINARFINYNIFFKKKKQNKLEPHHINTELARKVLRGYI